MESIEPDIADLPVDLDGLLASGQAAVEAVSQSLVDGLSRVQPQSMKHDRDPVSAVDLAIESQVRELLGESCPGIPVVGEEAGGTVPQQGLAWIVDPIDGTVNFLHGAPLCGVSLGLYLDKHALGGVIAFPAMRELYRGDIRASATCNGVVLRPRAPQNLRECVVAVGDYATGPGATEKNASRLGLHRRLSESAYRVRMLGSAALDLAWVAHGRVGASVALSNKDWDMAAGVAIARASGATVVGRDGEPHNADSTATIASHSVSVIEDILEILSTL